MPLDIQKLLQLQAMTRDMKRTLGIAPSLDEGARVQLSLMPYRAGWGVVTKERHAAIVKALLADPNLPDTARANIGFLVDVILKQTDPGMWRKG